MARIIGVDISLEDMQVQNIVPVELQNSSSISIEEFLEKLPQFDSEFDKLRNEARASGEVLRYVGTIQKLPKSNEFSCQVSLKR